MGDLIAPYVKSPCIPEQGVLGHYIDRRITADTGHGPCGCCHPPAVVAVIVVLTRGGAALPKKRLNRFCA